MLRSFFIVVATLLFTVPAAAKPTDVEQTELNVHIGENVEIITDGKPVRFRMAPDAVSVPTLNASSAQELGLKASMIGYVFGIGPVKISFRTDDVRYHFGTLSFNRRTAFSDRQIVDSADGVAGPETFPFRRTIFTLREPQATDRKITFPLDTHMGRSQTSVKIEVEGRPVYAAFSIDRAESLVTATGGQWIAEANCGRFDGEVLEAKILYGVSRPVRHLELERPLMLGELEIRNLAVRVSDAGNVQGIADGPVHDRDPNEIVVTGDGKRKAPNQRLYIGMDTIGHCASIAYDFEAATVTLMCPVQPAAAAMK